MTAPTSLWPKSDHELQRAQKSHGPTTSASLPLTDTGYHQIITWTPTGGSAGVGGWLDIGSAPGVDMTFAWTHDTGTVLTILAVWSNDASRTADPTVGAPSPYIPAVSATGTTPAYPNLVTFAKADWTTTTSPLSSSSVKYVRALFFSEGQRLVTFYAQVDAGTASVIAYASAATQS